MNHFSYQIRPLSPPNIHANSANKKIHQCPNCTCMAQHQFSPPLFIHDNTRTPHQNVQPKTYLIVNQPKIHSYQPLNAVKHIPTVYNKQNIYYHRPYHQERSNDYSQSSQNSNSHKYQGNTIQHKIYNNHNNNLRYQGQLGVRRPMSPVISGFTPQKINIRYVSPQPIRIIPPLINNNSSKVIYSNQSLYSFGEPKTPPILKQKKSGLKRMNSQQKQDSQSKQRIQIQKISQKKDKQIFNIYNSKQTQSIFLNPIKTKRNSIKINNQQSNKSNLPRIDNCSTSYTIANNSPSFSVDQVNMTPIKNQKQQDIESIKIIQPKQKQSFLKLQPQSQQYQYSYQYNSRNNSNLRQTQTQQQQKIADILTEQLKLNYDYFGKNSTSDLSIAQNLLK